MASALAFAAVIGAGTQLAHAGGGDPATLSPNPVVPGGTVTVEWGGVHVCGQFSGGFVSNVTLTGPNGTFGPFAYTGNPGQFTLPADVPLGTYDAQVLCGDSDFSGSGRTLSLTVGEPAADPGALPSDQLPAAALVASAPALVG
jgi:hypothetical protein